MCEGKGRKKVGVRRGDARIVRVPGGRAGAGFRRRGGGGRRGCLREGVELGRLGGVDYLRLRWRQ
eukprot:2471648-Pleurochrysis_carterae.AAC.1